MPCRDWGDNPSVVYRDDPETRRRLDLATRVACAALRTLSKEAINNLPQEVRVWWEKHQEMDRRREVAERNQRQKEAAKKRALNKLTPEERKALGV